MTTIKDRIQQLDSDIVHLFMQYGFIKKQKKVSKESFVYIFVKQNFFMILKGSINPYDYPGYINIIVGKGDFTYPSLDINGYPLWRIKRIVEHDNSTEYPFDILYDDNFVYRLQNDIEKYLMPFIRDGDMYWINVK